MNEKSIFVSKLGQILIGLGALSVLNVSIADTVPASGNLTLVSTDAAGKIKTGLTSPCGISADGSLIAFNSTASGFVSGDTNNSNDVFLKYVLTGSISRVSTTSSGGQINTGAVCQGMSADGSVIVLSAKTAPSSTGTHFVSGTEPALFVKHIESGELQRLSPSPSALPTTSDFVFRSISDDGNTVAYVTTPTSTYIGPYNVIPNGPARTLISKVSSGQLIDLTSKITLDIAGFPTVASSSVVLSADGTQLAFDSRADYPVVNDTNGKSDAFVLNLVSGALTLASTDNSNQQNVFAADLVGFNPGFKVAGFIADSVALYVPPQNSLGEEGLYYKNLIDNRLDFVASAEYGIRPRGATVPVSFSGDGTKLAFTRREGNQDIAILKDVFQSLEQIIAVNGSGVIGNNQSRFPLISQADEQVLFQSNATNLSRTARYGTFELYVKSIDP